MARTTPLQQVWRGMRQDEERGRMVRGALWNMVDVVPEIDDAPAGKRGGWAYGSNDISATKGTASYVSSGLFAPFNAGAKLVAIDEDGELYTINTGTLAVTDIGAVVAPLQLPVLHGEKLIIPASDGTTGPKYYDGVTTVGALAGSPPAGKYAAVFKDRTVLGPTSANKTKSYFSGAADPTSWDTTNGYVSTLAPPTGYAALPNALLIFQDTQTSRVRGYTPPPNGDFILDDPLFKIGCTDARSIAVDGAYCVFANPRGLYLSDGTLKPEDLTESIGLKRYWASLFTSAYSPTTWTIAGGIVKNHYIVSIMNGAAFVDALMINIADRRGWRISNAKFTSFFGAVTVGEEMYVGLRSAARVARLSTMFTPGAAVKNDADGTAVTPVAETAFFRDRGGFKRCSAFFLGYDMRDAATDNPALTLSYITNPEDAYTAFATALPETTNYQRALIREATRGEGIGFKIAQTNASATTRLYDIEAQIYAEEQSRAS